MGPKWGATSGRASRRASLEAWSKPTYSVTFSRNRNTRGRLHQPPSGRAVQIDGVTVDADACQVRRGLSDRMRVVARRRVHRGMGRPLKLVLKHEEPVSYTLLTLPMSDLV